MKKIIFFLILPLIISSCRNSERCNDEIASVVDKITEEEALSLLHKWTDAYLAGDATPLNEVLDESWIYSGSSDGKVADKSATIEEFSNADYKFEDIMYEELVVRLYDDIAIVRGQEKMIIVGSSGQDTTELRLRFTDVYQKKDGKIRAIATHSSPIIDE